ncbi:MAG: TIGR03364 family FAD-dependent oxidoreductase [Oscillatoriophycideae cyanobacterium NC_groundwater_1537_Pr4_S-0.65um_50_18]|nr:TIGR03364 family FAD-dependent oxidoreductase [Oscillatoriophycideae cyanobacterium NC_groundwater_1537_Pr4_S-0.65um_50_18]
MNRTDIAIVGAGILGLAHARAAAKRGLKVTVFERNPQAIGASIRNFGMIWPIGQPQGHLLDRALKTRAIWLEVASQAGFHADACGSLHLAYRSDEMAVLEEFMAAPRAIDSLALLTPQQAAAKSPAIVTENLLGALHSSTEVIVDPREAIGKIPAFLAAVYGVDFKFGTAVTQVESSGHPTFIAGGESWTAQHLFVCSGVDFETLYPSVYANSGITKVKLQMMRTAPQPDSFRLGAALCGGLTLTHYEAFAHCSSVSALKDRIATETPEFPRWGIHVMVSQNAAGELVIGDSHEYGLNPSPFDKAEINDRILTYLKKFAKAPSFEVAETWHGLYAKISGKTEFIVHPEPGVTIAQISGGIGMTLSFQIAEEGVASILGD